MSAVSRLSFVHATGVTDYTVEIGGMLAGGIIAAWLGAGYLSCIPKSKIMDVIAALLIGTGGWWQWKSSSRELRGQCWLWKARGVRPLPVAGVLVGTINSPLGVADG